MHMLYNLLELVKMYQYLSINTHSICLMGYLHEAAEKPQELTEMMVVTKIMW